MPENVCTKVGGAWSDPPALGSEQAEKILAARATLASAVAAFGLASWLRWLLVLVALLGCVADFLMAQAQANSLKEELFNHTSIAEWDVLRRSAQQTYYANREVQAQQSMRQPLAAQACFFVDLAGGRGTSSVPRYLVVPFEESPDRTCPSWRSLLGNDCSSYRCQQRTAKRWRWKLGCLTASASKPVQQWKP